MTQLPRTIGYSCRLFLILWCSNIVTGNCYAETPRVSQTQNELKALEQKMHVLEDRLSLAHNKQSILNQELVKVERNFTINQKALQNTQLAMKQQQQQIDMLQLEVNQLTHQLAQQQNLLARQIQMRYQMKAHHPIHVFFDGTAPALISRRLMQYRYIIDARKKAINRVLETKKTLDVKEKTLRETLLVQQQLHKTLHHHQQQIDHDRQYRLKLISTLKTDIQQKQQTLITYQRNKANLSRILTTLVQQSLLQTRHPLSQLRRKLQAPVVSTRQHTKKYQQGILFEVPQGSPVHTIADGKVIFSQALNGYGLLLIIDHGWGYMSLYANNQSLLKHKGDVVRANDIIAKVGSGNTQSKNGLYFEIRHRGKVVNPLEWLS
jgi:septal ring factor EnvC (AmiA/AmiB activator)